MEFKVQDNKIIGEGLFFTIYFKGERSAIVFSEDFLSIINDLPALIEYNKKLIDVIEKLLHKSVDAKTYNEAVNLINSFEIRERYGI